MKTPFEHYAFLAPFTLLCRDCFEPMRTQNGELHEEREQPELVMDAYCTNQACPSIGTVYRADIPIGAIKLEKKLMVIV